MEETRRETLRRSTSTGLLLTLAMARRPELLVLDEPTSGLDPLARQAFLAHLMKQVATSGMSVTLFVTFVGGTWSEWPII